MNRLVAKESKRVFEGKEVLYIVGLVFLACTIIAGLGFVLVDHQKAITALDISGISVSIVLAIIAIVYTMVDTSGQKELVASMDLSVRELDERVKLLHTVVDDLNDGIKGVRAASDNVDLMSQMFASVTEMVSRLDNMESSISRLVKQAGHEENGKIDARELMSVLEQEMNAPDNQFSHWRRIRSEQRVQSTTDERSFHMVLRLIEKYDTSLTSYIQSVIQRTIFSLFPNGMLTLTPISYADDSRLLQLKVIFKSTDSDASKIRDALRQIQDPKFLVQHVA